MARYLSPEWLDLLVDATATAAATDEAAALTGCVQRVVTGAPGGDVTYHLVLDAGAVVAAGTGPAPEGAPGPVLTLTSPYDVAAALLAGDVDAAVAYMQGRLKAEGDMPLLYALLSCGQTDAGRARVAAVRARTDV